MTNLSAPRRIEAVIQKEITRLCPHIVVTYAVHGISGFHDHLVSHAVVKRAFVEIENQVADLRLLALKLYEKGILGMGKARELIGVGKLDFLYILKEEGIPLNYDREELEDDLQTIEGI
ncbi:MAG: UPF0175 family protein [Candidatus Aminicenantes bacterium]|nr:UPF0175 family protein [Candidatus Aminicenantes bacterium]